MKYLLFFLTTFSATVCNAQTAPPKLKPFIEIGGGLGTGVTHDLYKTFVDVRGGVFYPITETTGLMGSVGFVQFFRREGKTGASFWPLAAGVNHNMSKNIFVELQLGSALLLKDNDFYFIAEPGMGWMFNPHHAVKIAYYGFVTNGLVIGGINLTYRFRL